MDGGEVVYLAGRKPVPQAKEFAVLFRLVDGEVQFKVFGEALGGSEKASLAAAMVSAASTLNGAEKTY